MDKLLTEAKAIQDYLEISCSGEINEMMERLSTLNVYMARSGEMLADAMQLQDRAINAVYAEQRKLILKMPATIASKFVNSCCDQENRLVKWLERINATCKHQSDNLRTQISFAKEQFILENRVR
jgi:hypothetical protein